MAQTQALPDDPNDMTPYLRKLFGTSDINYESPPEAPLPGGAPSVSAQRNRVEDDQTAGTRGTTPQSPTTSPQGPTNFSRYAAAQGPAIASGNNENVVGTPTQPLQEQIRQEQLEYGRMSQPPAKKSLGQRIGSGILGAIQGGATGAQGEQALQAAATRRQQMQIEQANLKNDLANRIATNTQALSQQQSQAAERELAARIAAQEREDYANIITQGKENVAGTQAQAHLEGIGEQQAGATGRTQAQIAGGEYGNRALPHITVIGPDGKSHIMQKDPQSGAYSTDLGLAPPTYAQIAPSLRTVNVIDEDPDSPTYGMPMERTLAGQNLGVAGAGAVGHQIAQSSIVQRAGSDLISDITANKDRLGTLSAWVNKYGLNTPIADPTLAKLQAEFGTFAALQPAMHGFRGGNALETFNNIIGGLQKNPDATIQSIQGILRTAGAINPGGAPSGGQRPQQSGGPQLNEERPGPNGQPMHWDGKGWLAGPAPKPLAARMGPQ